jgi:hypothetical protein
MTRYLNDKAWERLAKAQTFEKITEALYEDRFADAMQELAKLVNRHQGLTDEDVARLKEAVNNTYICHSDDMELDDVPYISVADGGTWVYGCFWIPNEDEE